MGMQPRSARVGSAAYLGATRAAVCLTLAASAACNDAPPPESVDALSYEALPDGDRATITEPFSAVHDLIELDDSVAIVNDPREGTVWRVNFARGVRKPFGRSGDGPGEYRSPAAVLRLGGDTIVIASEGSMPRLALLSTVGTPLGTRQVELPRTDVRANSSAEAAFDEWPPQPSASDGRGYLYGVRPRLPAGFKPLSLDDDVRILLRFDVMLARVDTIAMVRPTDVRRARPTGTGVEMELPLGDFEVSDAWTVLHDGTVIVVDEGTYALTAHAPDGSTRAMPPVPFTPRAASTAAWQQYVDSTRSALLAMLSGAPSMVEGAWTVRVPDAPTTFPPVLASATRRVRTDGAQLWVPVPGAREDGREYWDVLHADGSVQGRIVLPAGRRLVAVSSRYVYSTETAADELRVLVRTPRPASLVSSPQ
jgi:hypothetical protein